MASEDPFTQMGLANLYIGNKPPEEQQSQQQPSYDVWGLTPTVAPPAPAGAPAYAPAYAPNTNSSLVAAQPPAAQPPTNAPPIMQAPAPMPMAAPAAASMTQQAPVATNPYAQQPYPPQQQQQVMHPPPLQAQQQQPHQPQYAPVYAAPAPTPAYAAPAPTPAYAAPAPVYAPVPAPPQPVASLQAPAPQPAPAGTYNPFAATAAAPPTTSGNPFASTASLASTASRDESPPPQRPPNASDDSQTFQVADANPEPSCRSTVDVNDEEADFWAQMGFSVQDTAATTATNNTRKSLRASIVRTSPKNQAQQGTKKAAIQELPSAVVEEGAVDDQGLPVGGQYYNSILPGGYFGAVLKRAVDLDDSVFSTAPKSFIKTIGDRPVVAYTSQDSVVDKAGIAVGDVVLQVQGDDVNLPKTALAAIRRICDQKMGYHGIELRCWTPPSSIDVTLAENQCMVTYHGQQTNVPSKHWEWKSKYVVVGGVNENPWSIKMFYTKRDYDVAVSETNAKQPKISVKVKSYSLRGGKLLTPKPKTVFYSTQSQTWYFIMVQLTEKNRVIKIAHPLREGLQPVLDGIERVLKIYGRKKFGV